MAEGVDLDEIQVAAGHRPGDPAELVTRPGVVRTDSAGCTHGFVWGCRDRNIGFAVVARSTRDIAAAISRTYTETNPARWAPARRQTARSATAPRWPSSPTWSTCPTGPKAPG